MPLLSQDKEQVLLTLGCPTLIPGKLEKQLVFETAGCQTHDDPKTTLVEAPDVFGCEPACTTGSGPRKSVAVVLG